MPTSCQILRHKAAALGTSLACATGRHIHHFPTSTPSLAGKNLIKKHRPTGIQHRLAKLPLCQAFDAQVFYANQIKLFDQPGCQFEVKVFALVSNFEMQLCNLPAHSLPSLRAFHLFAQDALLFSHSFLYLLQPLRILYKLAAGKCQQVLNSNIDANSPSCWWQRLQRVSSHASSAKLTNHPSALRLIQTCLVTDCSGKGQCQTTLIMSTF